jgi:hypothetical protein
MTVRFAAALPKEAENNGLTLIEKQLIDDPEGTHVIVGIIDTKKIITDIGNADTIPHAEFKHVEVITGASEDSAREMLAAAALNRNGSQQLPLDDGDDDED